MKKYEKPSIIINEEVAEGVYAASGSDCMSVKAYVSQNPSQNPAGKFVVWVESNHDKSLYGGDKHTASGITVTLYFNQPVTCQSNDYYQGEPGTSYTVSGGNGSSALTLTFSGDTANAGTKFWGQIYVASEAGLSLNNAVITCHPVY